MEKEAELQYFYHYHPQKLNKKFLRGFIGYLEQKGCKGNTIWLYLRTLRALYNKAIEEGYARFENYPFRNRLNPHGIAIEGFAEETFKRALTKEQLAQIINADLFDPELTKARDYFLFSYYTRGMVGKQFLEPTMTIKGGKIFTAQSRFRDHVPGESVSLTKGA